MDIYSFINSPDVAAYCREIGKTWTPFEMAVIIGRSTLSLADKHAGWRAIISDYPDMPTPSNIHYKSYESLHKILAGVIAYEEYAMALFRTPEPGAFYDYVVDWNERERNSGSIFTTFEKAWGDLMESWTEDEAPKVRLKKVFTDNHGLTEAIFDHHGGIYDLSEYDYDNEEMRKERYQGIDLDSDTLAMFDNMFYVDIPLPFQDGDILTIRYNRKDEKDPVFVIEPNHELAQELREKYQSGKHGDGSDMIDWGFYISEEGVAYGDHTGAFDSFEYYRGKLAGNDRLLHYISLYLKDEIGLPGLLVMQGRIILEHQLEQNLRIDTHGVFISEPLLAENRLTQEEKDETEKTGGVMPWIAGKLSIHQVEFLAREFGGDRESVQAGLANGGGGYLGSCAGIAHDENHHERTGDASFNPARRDMARMVLAAYNYTEDDWIDGHKDGCADDGGIPMPDYTKMK